MAQSGTHCGDRLDILGVRVHCCGQEEAELAVADFLRERPARLHRVCTVNPEFVMEARRSRAFREVLNSASLATPDGVGIVAAARLFGKPLPGRATGVAMVHTLAEMSARDGWSLFLLGAGTGVAEAAGRVLRERYGEVQIKGTYAGSPQATDWPGIKSRIEKAQPDVLLVAYGAPRQDIWIYEHRHEFPASVKVAMGVGGVFDYLSGRVPLAPPLVRRVGLEWLYRLVHQPWRWRRILRVFAFAALVLAEAGKRRLKRET